MINACQALPSLERAVGVACGVEAATSCVMVTIQDEGIGIPSKKINCITDSFFTTRRATGAMGLGLWVAQGIVMEHGGRLEISSAPDAATTVCVFSPALQDSV